MTFDGSLGLSPFAACWPFLGLGKLEPYISTDDYVIRILWLILMAPLLLLGAQGQTPELQGLLNKPEIASLSEITRADHSTIFFNAYTSSWVHGYIRDGEVHVISLNDRSDADRCSRGTSAVSHDGYHIAYSSAAGDSRGCQIVLRDLRTGNEKSLAVIEKRPWSLSWSWDDTEIAYGQFSIDVRQGQAQDIFAVSLADGSKRDLGRLQIGKWPAEIWELLSIQWLHHGPELVLNISICIPDRRTAGCTTHWQTLLFSQGNSRVLAFGVFAAVSPTDDEIAYIGDDEVRVIDADGSNRRVITKMPAAVPFLPFLRESPWGQIVWSPKGDQLWISTIIDEGGNTNLYLVDVRTGHQRKVLKRTLITITAWR
jgi:hypothetical protein